MQNKDNKKIFVVLNPVAGKTNGEDARELIEDILLKEKIEFAIYETTGKEVIRDIVSVALNEKKYSIVIAAGGDGTISDTAEALVNTDIPLGIVPLGSSNSLAQELDVPLDTTKAMELIIGKNSLRKIDGMRVGDRYYFLDISVGAKSLTIRDTDRATKQKFGILAYPLKGIKRLFNFKPKRFKIEIDGQEIERKAIEVAVANGGVIGQAAIRYGSHVSIDDGILNIVVIRARSFFGYLRIALKFLFPNEDSNRNVKYYEITEKVKISSRKPYPVQADGEIIGNTPVEIYNEPKVLNVIVGR